MKLHSYDDYCDYEIIAAGGKLYPNTAKGYFQLLENCPYCGDSLDKNKQPGMILETFADHYRMAYSYPRYVEYHEFNLSVAQCTNERCGWWAIEQVQYMGEWGREEAVVRWGQIRIFDVNWVEAPVYAVRMELAKNPGIVGAAHQDNLGKILADCLKDKLPACEVALVGKSEDGSTDIYGLTANDRLCFVQVKRGRSLPVAEGPDFIREINGVLVREGVYRGLSVTRAKRFADSAGRKIDCNVEPVKPSLLELTSYTQLLEALNLKNGTAEPWRAFLQPLSNEIFHCGPERLP